MADPVRPYGLRWWGWVLGINILWPLGLSLLIRVGPLADSAFRSAAVLTCVLLLLSANHIMGRLIGGAGWIWGLSALNLLAYFVSGSIAFLLMVPDLPALLSSGFSR